MTNIEENISQRNKHSSILFQSNSLIKTMDINNRASDELPYLLEQDRSLFSDSTNRRGRRKQILSVKRL